MGAGAAASWRFNHAGTCGAADTLWYRNAASTGGCANHPRAAILCSQRNRPVYGPMEWPRWGGRNGRQKASTAARAALTWRPLDIDPDAVRNIAQHGTFR